MKNNYKWIKWGEKEIREETFLLLDEIKNNIKKIISIKKEERDFKNTILALEYLFGEKENTPNFISTLAYLSPKENIRKSTSEYSAILDYKITSLMRNKKLYKSILEYEENFKKNNEKILPEEKKLLKETIFGFKKMGFDLTKEKEKVFKKNKKRLSRLEVAFSRNSSEYKNLIEIDEKDFADLPDFFVKLLVKNKKGKYEISVDFTQSNIFLENSRNDKKKKELVEKISQRGGKKNLKILDEITKLRKENAKILGYKNHAEFVLEDRMVEKPEVVEKFKDDLFKKLFKKARSEIKDLEKFKNEFNGTKNKKLEFYNKKFYGKKYLKEKFNLDTEYHRQFFELENVLKHMFDMFGNLFGFYIEEKNKKMWNSDVRFFEIYDKKTKERISDLILDLFPRDGKYQGAFKSSIFQGGLDEKENWMISSVVISANFRKANKKIPSLLSIGDIETLFHEFGHASHQFLSKVKIPSQFGTSVKWDFVETPSQLLENWIEDEKIIYKISKHYETGKKLDKKYIKRISDSDNFLKATFFLRQLTLVEIDMRMHVEGVKDSNKKMFEIEKNFYGNKNENIKDLFPASFNHMMGYDAGYYSYLWSLVYADDIFSEFKKAGILNKKIGQKYRKEILEFGGSREEKESVEKFLGRKSNNKAFLKKLK